MSSREKPAGSPKKPDTWTLERSVEDHPHDHTLRWRLAKRLYLSWEYARALEHLLLLKDALPEKVNVRRYLAATYYRLGKYADALNELEAAMDAWPEEIGLFEQYARVLEVSERKEDAVAVWREILQRNPHHPIAKSAISRLQRPAPADLRAELNLTDSDSGIDLAPRRLCPNCGAMNSSEFERCWQCHAAFDGGAAIADRRALSGIKSGPILSEDTINLILGLTIVLSLSICVYLSLRLLLAASGAEVTVVASLSELYAYRLAWSRVATGLALVCGWPFALVLCWRWISREQTVTTERLILLGLLMGAIGFLGMWLPASLLPLAVLIPILLSLACIVASFKLSFLRSIALWALHLVLVWLISVAAFAVAELVQLKRFYNPLAEIPAVLAYAGREALADKGGGHSFPTKTLPIRQPVVWSSTGSKWLDARAAAVEFLVYDHASGEKTTFEIKDRDGTRVFEYIQGARWFRVFEVVPEEPYEVRIGGLAGETVQIVVTGLLVPDFEPEMLFP